jgi:hypothetical protein
MPILQRRKQTSQGQAGSKWESQRVCPDLPSSKAYHPHTPQLNLYPFSPIT